MLESSESNEGAYLLKPSFAIATVRKLSLSKLYSKNEFETGQIASRTIVKPPQHTKLQQ